MKLKNVCPYRIGQKVCCLTFDNIFEPITRIEKTPQGFRVWVRTENGDSFWPEEFANNGRLTVQE